MNNFGRYLGAVTISLTGIWFFGITSYMYDSFFIATSAFLTMFVFILVALAIVLEE